MLHFSRGDGGHRVRPAAGWRWMNSSNCNARYRARRKNFEARARGLPCAGNNRLMKPFSSAARFFRLRAAQDEGAAGNCATTWPGRIRCGGCFKATLVPARQPWPLVARLMGAGKRLPWSYSWPRRKFLGRANISRRLKSGSDRWAIEVRLQTGSHKVGRHKKAMRRCWSSARTPLIESGFAMERLGLVIIGRTAQVWRRAARTIGAQGTLSASACDGPATPIPRNAGPGRFMANWMFSVIDELPGGRGRIKTFRADEPTSCRRSSRFIREKLAGRTAGVCRLLFRALRTTGSSGLKSGHGGI